MGFCGHTWKPLCGIFSPCSGQGDQIPPAHADMRLKPTPSINNVSLCSQTHKVLTWEDLPVSPQGFVRLPNRIPPAAAISYICCIDVVPLDCSEEFISLFFSDEILHRDTRKARSARQRLICDPPAVIMLWVVVASVLLCGPLSAATTRTTAADGGKRPYFLTSPPDFHSVIMWTWNAKYCLKVEQRGPGGRYLPFFGGGGWKLGEIFFKLSKWGWSMIQLLLCYWPM